MSFPLKPVCPLINATRKASKRALWQARYSTYVVYVILDPTAADHRGRFREGQPIYVGRSHGLYARIRVHIGNAKKAKADNNTVAGRIRQILDCGNVPVFRLLEHTDDKALLLDLEKQWIKRFADQGYRLYNIDHYEAVPSLFDQSSNFKDDEQLPPTDWD